MTAGDGYRYYTHEASMKVPPKRKGNQAHPPPVVQRASASMKVPPKRKGNPEHGTYPFDLDSPQ